MRDGEVFILECRHSDEPDRWAPVTVYASKRKAALSLKGWRDWAKGMTDRTYRISKYTRVERQRRGKR